MLPGRFRPYEEHARPGRERGRTRERSASAARSSSKSAAPRAPSRRRSRRTVRCGALRRRDQRGETHRFRFLRPAAPAPDVTVDIDFTRALLPPCASPTTSSAPPHRRAAPCPPRSRPAERNLVGA
ncbi:hypothetical protein [Streptomyces sp. NPDC018833]|uniref:hypothetical protein n=1 Tax=Streptomyces sp. NPDC018833 TaxID=3365053 RepID=UPI003787EF6F